MLKTFSVFNFKGFSEEIVFDLTSSNAYTFNPECVKNGIVNSGMIYGYNGCGKSNLGMAIFDIFEHLTDYHYSGAFRYKNYVNAATGEKTVSFSYKFLFDDVQVQYDYEKTDYKTLVYEKFSIDGKDVVLFDRKNGESHFKSLLAGTESLNTEITDPRLSVLKYIKNNTVLPPNKENTAFSKFFAFVEKMLFFRSLEDRTYIGQKVNSVPLPREIIDSNKVEEFEEFLNEGNVNCKLAVVKTLDGKDLAFDFGKKKILFSEAMSTGTSAMMLFFYWYIRVMESKVSFVFIDEFDAFYHHSLSRLIVKKLIQSGVQFVVTTHNTSLMSNDLLRPDCYYLMRDNKIKPLSCCTEKELRYVHNIEKIYKGGGFHVG